MATYPLPSIPLTPATEDITLFRKQGIAQSPFSGHSSIINNYAQWSVNLTFPTQKRGSDKAKEMIAWLASLRGSEGSFLYQPSDAGKPVTGKSLLTTGFADSNAINVAGWVESQALGVGVGDYFSINNQLYLITSAPELATSGHATINFEPALRDEVEAGTTVNFETPKVELRWVGGDGSPGYNNDASFTYFKALNCAQVI